MWTLELKLLWISFCEAWAPKTLTMCTRSLYKVDTAPWVCTRAKAYFNFNPWQEGMGWEVQREGMWRNKRHWPGINSAGMKGVVGSGEGVEQEGPFFQYLFHLRALLPVCPCTVRGLKLPAHMAATVHGSQIQLWWRKKEREKESAASTCMKNTVQESETLRCVSATRWALQP